MRVLYFSAASYLDGQVSPRDTKVFGRVSSIICRIEHGMHEFVQIKVLTSNLTLLELARVGRRLATDATKFLFQLLVLVERLC